MNVPQTMVGVIKIVQTMKEHSSARVPMDLYLVMMDLCVLVRFNIKFYDQMKTHLYNNAIFNLYIKFYVNYMLKVC